MSPCHSLIELKANHKDFPVKLKIIYKFLRTASLEIQKIKDKLVLVDLNNLNTDQNSMHEICSAMIICQMPTRFFA